MVNQLRLVASPDAADGSLTIHTDARIYLAKLDTDITIDHELAAGRHAWIQVLRGKVTVNGSELDTSDGMAVSEEERLNIQSLNQAEIMVFDLP